MRQGIHAMIFVLSILFVVVFGLLCLDTTLVRSSVQKRFGIALSWRESFVDRLSWQARLMAARQLAMDAAEFRRWADAGCPDDWPFDPCEEGALDEDAERWVLAWIEASPENAKRIDVRR